MKIHRFIGAYQLGIGALRIDDAELAHQMRSVLKLAPGEMVMIGDGSGREVHCRIAAYDRHAVLLEGLAIEQNANEPHLQATLYCAILKSENFELAAQKATEVGVTEVVPLITKRTVKLNLRTDRVERIVREAAELAGRGRIPVVREPQPVEAVLTHASAHDVNIFFDPSGSHSIRCLSERVMRVFGLAPRADGMHPRLPWLRNTACVLRRSDRWCSARRRQ